MLRNVPIGCMEKRFILAWFVFCFFHDQRALSGGHVQQPAELLGQAREHVRTENSSVGPGRLEKKAPGIKSTGGQWET